MSTEVSKQKQARERAKPFIPPKEPAHKKQKIEAGKYPPLHFIILKLKLGKYKRTELS